MSKNIKKTKISVKKNKDKKNVVPSTDWYKESISSWEYHLGKTPEWAKNY